jgi:hypothetical protein
VISSSQQEGAPPFLLAPFKFSEGLRTLHSSPGRRGLLFSPKLQDCTLGMGVLTLGLEGTEGLSGLCRSLAVSDQSF